MPKWVSLGWMSSAGILVIRQREQRRADDDPDAELGRSREPQVAPTRSVRAAVSGAAIPSCYGFVHRRSSPGRRLVRCASRPTTAWASRPSSPGPAEAPGLLLVHGFGGAKEDFADHVDGLARDHRVVTFDHRGHGESDASRRRPPPTPSTGSRPTSLAVADATGLARSAAARPLDGRHGHAPVGARRTRRGCAALVFMDTSAGPPPGLDRELVALGVEVARNRGPGGAQAAVRRARPARLAGLPAGAGRAARASGSTPTTSGRPSRR